MKTINKISIISAVILCSCCSCSDFLEVYPENSINSNEFLKTEKDMELYTNGLLNNYLPSHNAIAFADENSDVLINRNVNSFLDGDTWRPEDQGGWS